MLDIDPKFYGGLNNSLTYKGFDVQFFLEFKKQLGSNYLSNLTQTPGYGYNNQPTIVLERWQRPNDVANISKFIATTGDGYSLATTHLKNSEAIYGDASYIRLKNAAIHYNLPNSLVKKLKLSSSRIFLQGQNLLTITSYRGGDPETQNILSLPPIQIFTAGFQLTL